MLHNGNQSEGEITTNKTESYRISLNIRDKQAGSYVNVCDRLLWLSVLIANAFFIAKRRRTVECAHGYATDGRYSGSQKKKNPEKRTTRFPRLSSKHQSSTVFSRTVVRARRRRSRRRMKNDISVVCCKQPLFFIPIFSVNQLLVFTISLSASRVRPPIQAVSFADVENQLSSENNDLKTNT